MKPVKCPITIIALLALFGGVSNVWAQQQSYDAIRVALFQTEQAKKTSTVAKKLAEKAAVASPKKPTPKKPTSVTNFDIYRDRNPLPIDPRKPCNECVTRQADPCEKKCKLACLPGFKGQPFRDREPGGCKCGKCCTSKKKRPLLSVYWPSVLNAVCEEHDPVKAAQRAANLNRFRINNLFDCVGGFELSPYERCDNGYCGKGRDRYGCLGESRYLQSNVGGVGFRVPGQPVARGEIEYP